MTPAPHVAIIDDDESLRLALMGLTRSLGMEASGYASAEEFLSSDAPESFACIITDIQMPGMSGIDLKLHLAARDCSLPVIMITGRPDPKLKKKAEDAGAAAFLRKPFEPGVVIASLEKVLGNLL